mgnify:CR=1|jgi:hypothetical protein
MAYFVILRLKNENLVYESSRNIIKNIISQSQKTSKNIHFFSTDSE